VKANRQRLDQAKFLQTEFGWIELLGGHADEFGHGTVALHSESLIELTCIRTVSATGGTLAAAGVRGHGYVYAGSELRVRAAAFHDRGRNFVAGNAGERNKRVLAAKGVEIAATQSDEADSEE
jgi:hypothetical protein